MDSAGPTDGLSFAVELVGGAIARRAAFLSVHIANRGGAPIPVSARLNLFEGDVRLLRRDPSGEVRRFDGWQIDTIPNPVDLPSGQALAGAVNLMESADGPVLDEAGPYELAAEYFPGVALPPVASPWIAVEVAAPKPGAEETALEALLADRWLRRALVKADAREAPEAMDRLAGEFPDRPEGELARLIVAGGRGEAGRIDWPALAGRHGVASLAVRLLALRTPYSDVGERLAAAYAAALEGLAADPVERERARRTVLREPLPV